MLNHNLIIGVLYSNYATLQLDWLSECTAKNVGKKNGDHKMWEGNEILVQGCCSIILYIDHMKLLWHKLSGT